MVVVVEVSIAEDGMAVAAVHGPAAAEAAVDGKVPAAQAHFHRE